MSILIKGATLNDEIKDIYIEGNLIKKIDSHLDVEACEVIDAKRKAVIPGFVNCHTHAAMTLFRGFGDDMPLMKWLTEKIWPNEAKLTKEDIYWGSKLALLEMIKTGTTTFVDMYMNVNITAEAVQDMGLRALLSSVCFDHFQSDLIEKSKKANLKFVQDIKHFDRRIMPAFGPHAIYTVSGDLLQWINDLSQQENIPIHLHLAETEEEVRNCVEKHGTTPVRYLNKLGLLSSRLIAAHVVYVDDEEISMLANNGVKVVHNPASNMKLGSGIEFKYVEMKEKGVTLGLGTDGCCSSNNLDMVEAMKLAALLGKGWRKNPEVIPAHDIYKTATEVGATIVGINAGKIEEGRLADLSLVDLKQTPFVPNHDFISNLVYAANGNCIDTVVCNGKILMKNRYVSGEDEIMEQAERLAHKLVER